MSTETVIPVPDTALLLHDLKHRRRDQALADLAACARDRGTTQEPERLAELLQRHERVYSSAVGKGVAIPHLRSILVRSPLVIVGRARRGIDWKARDGQEVQLVLAVFSPSDASLESFLDLVAQAAGAARLQRGRQRLLETDRAGLEAAWREAIA